MNNFYRPPSKQVAFTLLELIIVVIVLAILSSYVFTRFSSSTSYRLDALAEQLVAAGQLTQQLAMNDSQRAFLLDIQNSQINILVDGATFSAANEFPITVDSSISLSPTGTISFDGLGRTAGATITIASGESLDVCFEASGLVHRC